MAEYANGADFVIDTTIPQSPRVWNYWLGGKDNYEIDRLVGDQVRASAPQIVDIARASRAFLIRAVSVLAGELGIRQFLDVGTGLPTANNTHQVAQSIAADSRIVYVDNDPVVLAHARALLTSTPEGQTRYLDEDLYQPSRILAGSRGVLDLDEPVALILAGILGHVADAGQAKAIVSELMAGLPAGSYLVTCDSTNVIDPPAMNEAARLYNEAAEPKIHLRTPQQIADQFAGLELIEPGVVSCPTWRSPHPDLGRVAEVDEFGGVGRKPVS